MTNREDEDGWSRWHCWHSSYWLGGGLRVYYQSVALRSLGLDQLSGYFSYFSGECNRLVTMMNMDDGCDFSGERVADEVGYRPLPIFTATAEISSRNLAAEIFFHTGIKSALQKFMENGTIAAEWTGGDIEKCRKTDEVGRGPRCGPCGRYQSWITCGAFRRSLVDEYATVVIPAETG